MCEQPRSSCFYFLSSARLEGMWTETFGCLLSLHYRFIGSLVPGLRIAEAWFRSSPPTSFHDAETSRAPCRRSGDPPRFSWEGKLELTEALRHLSQPREFQKVSTQENPEGSLQRRGSERVSVVFSRSVALLVFFPAAAGAGVVAADFVFASLNSLRCGWFFSAIEDEWGLGA